MRALKLILALLLLATASIGTAWADHHGHVHFGVMIGPGWGPWYYPPPPYYYPPYYAPVVVERPQVYVEQQPAAAPAAPAPAASNVWYYCPSAKGYYPYVKVCPGGWQTVSPQPPAQP